MNWSDTQLRAIGHDTGNCIVNAGAGSGKTAVLTERIVRGVREGIALDRMLIATFTNAAAAEMRERIRGRLQDELAKDTSSRALRNALNMLPDAHITTLHGFCGEVLRTHYAHIGLPPDFSLLDEARAAELLEQSAREAVHSALESDDMDADSLCSRYGGTDAKKLPAMLIELYKKIMALPDPWMFCDRALDRPCLSSEEAFLAWEEVQASLQSAETLAETMISLLKEIHKTHLHYGNTKRAKQVESEMWLVDDLLTALYRRKDISKACGLVEISKNSLSNKIPGDSPYKTTIKPLHAALLDARDSLKAIPVCRFPVETLLKWEQEAHHDVSVCVGLLRAMHDDYSRSKRALGGVDFNDLEHFALGALAREDVREHYREQFTWLCIDEYQDINPVQEALIQAVSNGENLFNVGDVKQSIYGFRHAEPAIFAKKYARYSQCKDGFAIDMNMNYRSAPNVIGAVNAVFYRLMRDGLGGVEYDSRAALEAGRNGARGSARLRCLLPDESIDLPDKEYSAWYTARMITREILGKWTVQDRSTGKERPAQPGDIAILLSAPKSSATLFENELLSLGVHCATQQQDLRQTVEYGIALDLLRVVGNAQQDVPLIGLLRSVVAGLDVHELSKIRMAYSDAQFFHQAVRAYAQNGPDAVLKDKLQAFYTWLNALRVRSQSMPLGAFVSYALHEYGILEWVRALPGGHVRISNLQGLMNSARRFETHPRPSLDSFLRFLDRTELRDAKAANSGDDAQAVRIMSIHNSKGLEFPIVVLPHLHRKIRFGQDLPLMDSAVGISLPYTKSDPKFRYRTFLQRAMINRGKERTLSESMRLLYVAMTRARDHLVCVAPLLSISRAKNDRIGGISDRLNEIMSWDTPRFIQGVQSELELLVYALARTPGGEPLRVYAQTCEAQKTGAADVWQVEFAQPQAFASEEMHAAVSGVLALEEAAARADTQSAAYRRIEKSLQWTYSRPALALAKRTVSGLAGSVGDVGALPQTPTKGYYPLVIPGLPEKESRAEDISPTEVGSVLHTVLQQIDLQKAGSLEGIADEISRLESKWYLTPDEIRMVDIRLLGRFFSSPLGKRLRAANLIRREQPFHFVLRGCDAERYGVAEETLVQGILDCAFLEDGAYVLLDYKSGRTALRPEDIPVQYIEQLRLYRTALERLSGIPVKETHLLYLSDAVDYLIT